MNIVYPQQRLFHAQVIAEITEKLEAYNPREIEELRNAYAFAQTDEEKKKIATELQTRALEQVVYIPFGQWTVPLAYRADRLEGIVPNTGLAVLWIDNQAGCKGVCDRVPSARAGDHDVPGLCKDGECLDEAMLDGLDQRIAALEAELAEMKDRWMRAEAEMANVRARAKRDVDETRQFAVQKFAREVAEADRAKQVTILAAEAFQARAERFAQDMQPRLRVLVPFAPDSNLVCVAINPVGNRDVATANAYRRLGLKPPARPGDAQPSLLDG